MTVTELEHAASSPHRFIKSIRSYPRPDHEDGEIYQPIALQTRLFKGFHKSSPTDRTYPPFEKYDIDTIKLVPGGRFLFTSGANGLCLWDLGYSMHAPVRPYPIATLDLEDERTSTSLHRLAPCSDEQHIIVAITFASCVELISSLFAALGSHRFSFCSMENKKSLVILKIDPRARSPVFVRQAELDFDMAWPNIAHFDERAVLCVHKTEFLMWDWSAGSARKWSTLDHRVLRSNVGPYFYHVSSSNGLTNADLFCQTFLCRSTVVTLVNGDFCTWELPQLLPIAPSSILHFPETQVVPKIVRNSKKPTYVPESQWDDGPVFKFSCTTVWQTNHPPVLTILRSEYDEVELEGAKLCVYSFLELANDNASALPTNYPMDVMASNSCYDDSDEYKNPDDDEEKFESLVTEMFYCDGHHILCSYSSMRHIMGTVLEVPGPQNDHDSSGPVSAMLSDIPGWTYACNNGQLDRHAEALCFCPMSGRLLSLVKPGSNEPVELWIHDYILPLDEQD